MPDPLVIDLFAEDKAHEEFLSALIRRIAKDVGQRVELNVRSALGGHPRAFGELDIYQISVRKGATSLPDVLVVAIDANCQGLNAARKNITDKLIPDLMQRTVPAAPDPHIEKWFLADLDTFFDVVGVRPRIKQGKCDRTYYKTALEKAVREAGHPSLLGGIEFARDLVEAMDLYRAAKSDASLGHFIDGLRAKLRAAGQH
jgi:hypothetical protein